MSWESSGYQLIFLQIVPILFLEVQESKVFSAVVCIVVCTVCLPLFEKMKTSWEQNVLFLYIYFGLIWFLYWLVGLLQKILLYQTWKFWAFWDKTAACWQYTKVTSRTMGTSFKSKWKFQLFCDSLTVFRWNPLSVRNIHCFNRNINWSKDHKILEY